MGNWRTNVSILGLMNILDHANKSYTMSVDKDKEDRNKNKAKVALLVKKQVLDGFERDYFNYFIDSYEEDLPWYRISTYGKKVKDYLENLSELDEKDLKEINQQIDLVKDYMGRPNYTKIYEFIDEDIDIEEKVRELKKVNLRKNEEPGDRLEDIERELNILKEIIQYTKSEKARDYMGAKGVIYSYINRGIEGISFLNPRTQERDVFLEYKKYFLGKFSEYLEEDKDRFKYNCFSCGNKIRNLSTTMNLVKDTGFDRNKKSSHVWNHASDFAICSQCLFLYTCFSAGFYYSAHEGIFINYNYDLNGLKKINEGLKDITKNRRNQFRNAFSYRTLVNIIEKEYRRHIEFEIRDMQIIRYKNEKYRFNLLSKDALEIINKSKLDLDVIIKAGYKEGRQTYFSIYDLVLDRIFNNQNLFSLIHKLVVNLISKRVGIEKYYNFSHISRLLNINSKIIKEGNIVSEGKDVGKLTDDSRKYGYHLKQAYYKKMKNSRRVKNRMESIKYRMTNALKTNNSGAFMDILINSYAYVEKAIPKDSIEVLKNDERLRAFGYAFIVGISGYENNKGGKEDEK